MGKMKMEIREQKGEYAVIERDTKFHRFIVAWLPEQTEDGLEWAQGYYFSELHKALRFWSKKANNLE